MIAYRAFLNSDPPALAALWHASAQGRGIFAHPTVHDLQDLVFAKTYFDRLGLIVATDAGTPVGFAHAGFGPTPDGDLLSHSEGVICLVMVHPDYRQRGIGRELVARCEAYLGERGTTLVQAGCGGRRDPFYLGLYGGSEMPGVLDSLPGVIDFFQALGYGSGARRLVFHRDLPTFRPPIARPLMQLRRQTVVEVTADPPPVDWWKSSKFSYFERLRFELYRRQPRELLAQATVWLLDPISRSWGSLAAGMMDVQTLEPHRRIGAATVLLGDVMRGLAEQGVFLLEMQIAEGDEPAAGLLDRLGYQQVDAGTILTRELS